MKKAILSIPIIGPFVKKAANLFRGRGKFNGSTDYWESRYQEGGNSGAGSYDQLAEFKAEVLNAFVKRHDITKVIEFGSGDGNQTQYFDFKNYLGYDISKTAIAHCRKLYAGDTTKRFELLDGRSLEQADMTMSLDVLYHLVEDDVFDLYMKQVFDSSTDHVVIYSSNVTDQERGSKSPHVRHRKFTDWVEEHRSSFELVQHLPNKYPYTGDRSVSSIADFFFYRKRC